MGLTIMDPTDESEAIERSLASRDASLDNATIALIDMWAPPPPPIASIEMRPRDGRWHARVCTGASD